MPEMTYEAGAGEMRAFEPLPPAKYEAAIFETEVKDTTAGDMQQLICKWKVTSGENENRQFWGRINLPHPDHPVSSLPEGKQKAIEIGRNELDTLCRAVGLTRIAGRSEELHDRVCVVTLKIKPAEGKYAAGNEITKYDPVGGATAAAAPAKAAPPPAPKPSGPPKAPWAKK